MMTEKSRRGAPGPSGRTSGVGRPPDAPSGEHAVRQ